MNELKWAGATGPKSLLQYLYDADPLYEPRRKARLFACACCRRIWDLLLDERSRFAIEWMEEQVDELVTDEDWLAIHVERQKIANAAEEAMRSFDDEGPHQEQFEVAASAALVVIKFLGSDLDVAQEVVERASLAWLISQHSQESDEEHWLQVYDELDEADSAQQADLVREIFGNPFRRARLAQECLSYNQGTVIRLADEMYQERRFEEMPILGDALEESGCNNVDVLHHCRNSHFHVRGCWLLDLILCKE